MKRARNGTRRPEELEGVPDALAAYGEHFMSMFDDYDEQAAKRKKQPPASTAATAGNRQQPVQGSSSSMPSSEGDTSDSESEEDVDNDVGHGTMRPSQGQSGPSSVNSKLQEFLSGRKGNKGIRSAALKPSKEQLAAQQRQQEQQRLLERKMKRQFMSSKVDKIFNAIDPQQLAAAAAAAGDDDEQLAQELTAEQFAALKRDVEQLGASALDKRSAKAHKAAMLAKLGASAEKRPRIPAKMGLGMAKKAKQREAVALQEAIAAGMVKAKGRGKKQRAEKAKQRDKGLMEAGPGFKNGVLRLPKSALR